MRTCKVTQVWELARLHRYVNLQGYTGMRTCKVTQVCELARLHTYMNLQGYTRIHVYELARLGIKDLSFSHSVSTLHNMPLIILSGVVVILTLYHTILNFNDPE